MAKTRKTASHLLVLLVLGGVLAAAQEPPPSVYQVEAAFLYQFTKFVTWPPDAFHGESSPFDIGVMGDDPLGSELETIVAHKSFEGHPFRVRRLDFNTLSQARRCQVLFLPPMDRRRLTQVLESLKGARTLTVSRLERSNQPEVMINFFLSDKKVRFEINDRAATRARLKLSAKLLSLARKPPD
jgi:YfiR/HmsC-like